MSRIILKNKKYRELFGKTFGDGDYFDSFDESIEYFDNQLKKRLYLLFVNDELVGFFSYIYQYSHNANYLSDICVNSKFRKKGYSKILLQKYLNISKFEQTNNPFALSSTHTSNKISQMMHEKFGFENIGILKGLHFGRDDEIFYAYKLK